jgi:indolepyruvate ferredoxin oxidoreductase beta subunit
MGTTRLLIVAVGGQGNILTARVIGEAAVSMGIPVRMSEFHGMAQRGGVVESMILLGEGHSTVIADGEADVLVGFEPAETLRAAKKCNPETVVITNTRPVPPFLVALGKAQYPPVEESLEKLASKVKNLIAFDATELASKAGSVLSMNMVMLGALARSETIPVGSEILREAIKERIKAKKALLETNLRAFDLGYEAAAKWI